MSLLSRLTVLLMVTLLLSATVQAKDEISLVGKLTSAKVKEKTVYHLVIDEDEKYLLQLDTKLAKEAQKLVKKSVVVTGTLTTKDELLFAKASAIKEAPKELEEN